MAKTSPWKLEAELCADFIRTAEAQGWVAYAECGGWDILLVRPSDGYQIGIEAKLQLNATVLCQAMDGEDGFYERPGPDFRAILVPEVKTVNGLKAIARRLGITVIEGTKRSWEVYGREGWVTKEEILFSPALPGAHQNVWHEDWIERCPDERVKLPEFVPDVVAGDSGPVQLTDWKIKALKVIAILEVWGSVTRADFRALKIDPTRWTQHWLRSDGNGGWVKAERPRLQMPNFKNQHPVVYAKIIETFPEWSKALPARLKGDAA